MGMAADREKRSLKRRQRVARRPGRRRRWVALGLGFVALAAALAGMVWGAVLLWSSAMEEGLSGLVLLPADDSARRAMLELGLDEGTRLAREEALALVGRVERLEWVGSARVRMRPAASQAVLSVTVRVPVLALVAGGEVWGVCTDGALLSPGVVDLSEDLPLVSGIEPSALNGRQGRRRLAQAVEVLTAFEDFPWGGADALSQIDFEEEGVVVYLRPDGTKVLLGEGQYRSKLARLGVLLEDLRSRGAGAWAVDLRYDPAVCWPRSQTPAGAGGRG